MRIKQFSNENNVDKIVTSVIIFFYFFIKDGTRKKQQTKENQFQSSMSETGGHRKNIASSMFTILLGDSILTNQNSLRLKLIFVDRTTFLGLLTFRA